MFEREVRESVCGADGVVAYWRLVGWMIAKLQAVRDDSPDGVAVQLQAVIMVQPLDQREVSSGSSDLEICLKPACWSMA